MAVLPSKVYDFDPHNLPADLLKAVGLAVACGSQTEDILASAIGGCLGVDSEYSLALTLHMTLPLKLSILRSVAEIRIDSLDALDELDNLLDETKTALEKRHRWAHASLCRDPDAGELYVIKQTARVRLEAEVVPIEIRTVMADAETIYDAGMNLMTFLAKNDLLPPHPTSSRPRGHKAKAARKKRRKA